MERKKRLERTETFLKQVKAGIIFSRETKDETTLLVRDELRRQEDLEKRRLDFETKEMEKQTKNIFDQEAEVTGNTVKCDLISLFITQGRST